MIDLVRSRASRDNIFKRSNHIVIAFASILAILVLATAIILYQVSKTHTHLETVVNKNYIKTELLAQLKEYIRLRQIGLRDMMIVRDPFTKDEYKTKFYQYATNVTLIRDEFIKQGLSDEEKILIDKIRSAMTTAYPLQNIIADKIIFMDSVTALQDDLNTAFQKQKIVMNYINQLEQLIKSKNEEALSNAIMLQDNSVFSISLVGTISFLLGAIITITLIGINKKQEQLVIDTLGKLEHNNENLEEIVSERTSQLQAAKLKAEAANEEKSMFLSRMSHELRTPLNAVLGFNQLLHEDVKQPYLENEDKHIYITNIAKAGHHLLRLVNDVLDLSRIEQGKFELKMSETDVQQSILDSIELMKPMAQENDITLNFHNNGQALYAVLDKNRFEQVILNLISNAIKYNEKNGSVEIDCSEKDGKAIISITDNGIGIDENDIDVIFKPFNRLYLATVTNEGTGVGLSLSKYLIEEMGGNIGVSSEVGKGSTFWISVDLLNNTTLENDANSKSDKGNILNILYIEDDVDNIQLLKEITKTLPTQIKYHAAMTFSLATELAHKNQFDYIMVDINDNNLDANSLGKIKREKNSDTKIIGLVSDDSGLNESNKVYFDKIISKPFNISAVKNLFSPNSY